MQDGLCYLILHVAQVVVDVSAELEDVRGPGGHVMKKVKGISIKSLRFPPKATSKCPILASAMPNAALYSVT